MEQDKAPPMPRQIGHYWPMHVKKQRVSFRSLSPKVEPTYEYTTRANVFEKSVKNKFSVYNSLFLKLPFRKINNIGMLIPLSDGLNMRVMLMLE